MEEESCLNCKYGRFLDNKQVGYCINENTNRIFKNLMNIELLFYKFKCNYYEEKRIQKFQKKDKRRKNEKAL